MLKERIKDIRKSRVAIAGPLGFFDASLWLGPPENFPNAAEMSFAALKAACSRYFINGGLISHWLGKSVSAQDGNFCLMKEIPEKDTKFYTIWTGLPLFPEEPGPLPGRGALPANVKAARIFPKTNRFHLDKFVLAGLCKFLMERNMPLFIWHTELEWKALYEFAGDFPGLKIIVETQPQKILYHMRNLLPLMRARRNVLLEISNFAGPDYLEYGVKNLGAGRFVFGSFLPVNDPLSPIGMLVDAAIKPDDRQAVASGNLARIIQAVKS